MKIGILTFHRALNYGAVLQCYALQVELRDMGHDVEIIDYRPDYLERYRAVCSTLNIQRYPTLNGKAKETVANILSYPQRRKANHAFDCFLKEHFILSKPVYKAFQIPDYYDYIVFGSDQIWSPEICFGFDPIFWGQFQHGNTKLITYAASIGGHNKISDKQWSQIDSLIKNYNAVSVRERKLQKDLFDYLQYQSQLVVDPTLLCDSKHLYAISKQPLLNNYVLLFTLQPDDNSLNFAKNIAKQLNSKVVRLRAVPALNKNNDGVFTVEAATPAEFCGWFLHAKCIVTISFHGTAFSVIYHKDFYSLTNKQGDRAYNLLQSIGLESRMVNSTDNIKFTHVDYSGVEEKMDVNRKPSKNYLKENIE